MHNEWNTMARAVNLHEITPSSGDWKYNDILSPRRTHIAYWSLGPRFKQIVGTFFWKDYNWHFICWLKYMVRDWAHYLLAQYLLFSPLASKAVKFLESPSRMSRPKSSYFIHLKSFLMTNPPVLESTTAIGPGRGTSIDSSFFFFFNQ